MPCVHSMRVYPRSLVEIETHFWWCLWYVGEIFLRGFFCFFLLIFVLLVIVFLLWLLYCRAHPRVTYGGVKASIDAHQVLDILFIKIKVLFKGEMYHLAIR